MQQHRPTLLNRFRRLRGFLQVIVFALLAQAFVPAGFAVASDLQSDGEFETVICRALVDENDDGVPDGDAVEDCLLCLALDFSKLSWSSTDTCRSDCLLPSRHAGPIPGNALKSVTYVSSQHVRAPPVS